MRVLGHFECLKAFKLSRRADKDGQLNGVHYSAPEGIHRNMKNELLKGQ